jgi:hypothetical protein
VGDRKRPSMYETGSVGTYGVSSPTFISPQSKAPVVPPLYTHACNNATSLVNPT